MQFIFALIYCAIGVYSTSELLLSSPEWTSFKAEHNKNYENFQEELLRMKIYMENKRLVTEHNAKFAKGQALFSINMNRFADLVVMNGLDRSLIPKWRSKHYYVNSKKPIPESVDWREKGFVSIPQNQGPCGSCWSFSAVGAIEGQVARKTGKLIPLSVQSLVDCSTNNKGCLGGLMNQAFAHVNVSGGIVDEQSYPYVAKEGVCRSNESHIVAQVKGYYDIRKGNDEDLKDALANVGPVSIGIDATSPLLKLYEKGIFAPAYCSSYRVNHGVLAVGYGVENGVEYWIIKNSWGPKWGENGYFKLLKNGNNKCGISTLASFPVVSVGQNDDWRD